MKVIISDVEYHCYIRKEYTQDDVKEITDAEFLDIIKSNTEGSIIQLKDSIDFAEYRPLDFDYLILKYNDYYE